MSTNGHNGNGTAQMREKVVFPLNTPVLLTLEHDDGTPSAGRFGDQFMYTFSGGKIAWLDPDVRDQVLQCGARAGDEIAVLKREVRSGNRKRAVWEVAKVEDEPAPPEPPQPPPQPAPARTNGRPPAPQPAPQPAPAAAPASSPAQPSPALDAHRVAVAALVDAYKVAIDAALQVEDYARTRGLAVRFDTADIRAIAATLTIARRQAA